MGFSSQGGKVILRSQTVPGTYNADTGSAGNGVLLRSGSFDTNRDLLVTDPEIGAGRDVQTAYLGSGVFTADYEMYPRMNALATLLKAALGIAAAPVTTSGVTTHTITPSDAAQLPFLSVEEQVGAGLETFNYWDANVNTFHLECDANAYLMATAGLVAKQQLAGATPTASPTFDTTPLVVATNLTVSYNSVTIPVKSFSLDIDNQIETDDFRLGSLYAADFTPKRRNVTASFTVRESSSALWRQATLGQAAATALGGLPTKQALVISMLCYEVIPTSAVPYQCVITIPSYILSPYSMQASADDVIESSIDGQALRPSLGTPIMTAVIKTDGATVK